MMYNAAENNKKYLAVLELGLHTIHNITSKESNQTEQMCS